ncbi:hypothetical protein HYN59_04125 [Flavobacterium album]|uniref:PcfJ-like protein n=1 Tax=Flavobacterium album TaxID=2175091 RepID=A0A2S1QVU1_9FLAO|nr:PcfJ domain-containing protein [Flavobacterium album]AWH84351.1 hypothetical protein HYN59_04125 [Flavobacterium album]
METQSTAIRIATRPGFPDMVERLYTEKHELQYGETTLEGVIRRQFALMDLMGENHKPKKAAFRMLLLLIHTKKCYGVLRNPAFINVLVNIAYFEDKMVRPVNEWVKDALTAEGQLASLIRHCFAKYEVPEFMEYAFAESSRIPMYYYIKLGRGDSVQALNIIPKGFTARMAHEFRNTPRQFTLVQAIRRAQALGCGATIARAEAVAWAHEFERFRDAAFTLVVIRFVARVEEPVAFDQLQRVLLYLDAMYEVDNAYSLKGRTWASVAKRAAEYHAEMAKRLAAAQFSDWELCSVKNYEVQKEDAIFRIVQLGTSQELYEEGAEQSHCVADYAYDCTIGTCAIFSLRRFIPGDKGYITLATIEVAVETMEIVQAKAKFNEIPSDEARAIMAEWAATEKLTDGTFYEEEYVPPPPAAVHYQGGEPVQQPVDYYRAYRPTNELSATEVVRIVLIIIKILWILSKLR